MTFRLAIPERAHPLVKALYRTMKVEQCSVAELSVRSGVERNTIRNWRHHSNPRLTDIVACFQVLGKRLVVVDEEEQAHG